MGMDWHSSGITTSVMGALKRGLGPLAGELGIHVCGGRGRHSRSTPAELVAVGERVGIDGERLARTSRLVAKVDSAAIQDSFELYLHSFVVTDGGAWTVVQQGMNGERRQARRYHLALRGPAGFRRSAPRRDRRSVPGRDHQSDGSAGSPCTRPSGRAGTGRTRPRPVDAASPARAARARGVLPAPAPPPGPSRRPLLRRGAEASSRHSGCSRRARTGGLRRAAAHPGPGTADGELPGPGERSHSRRSLPLQRPRPLLPRPRGKGRTSLPRPASRLRPDPRGHATGPRGCAARQRRAPGGDSTVGPAGTAAGAQRRRPCSRAVDQPGAPPL